MGTRPTKRAGIPKIRVEDPMLQKQLDAIIERIEVLDGLRGDALDKAVTYRDLGLSGFTIKAGSGGSSGIGLEIINTPGPGDTITTGPTTPPTDLAVTETFLALLLTWNNPPDNLQHIQIFRAAVDNLSLAVLIGTTVSPQFVDYVGANAANYYWIRAVATEGSVTAYNDTMGTLGATGIDPSAILIAGGGFVIKDPGDGPDISPFIVGTVNDETAVGLDGQFLVDGTIRAASIIAGVIGAREIGVEKLSALTADMGTLRAGRITTGTDGTEQEDWRDQEQFRVEIEGPAGTGYPLWFGNEDKSSESGRFYVDVNGNVVVKGLLQASMIRQSLFTPAGDNDPFRIATEYPSKYIGSIYTGKKAHLFPMKTSIFNNGDFRGFGMGSQGPNSKAGPEVTFLGPLHDSDTEYGRLGTYSEQFMVHYDIMCYRYDDRKGNDFMHPILEYRYDGATWEEAWKFTYALSAGNIGASTVFVSRETPWNTLGLRIRLQLGSGSVNAKVGLHCISLQVWTPNFGYADAIAVDVPSGENDPGTLPLNPKFGDL